MSSRDRRLKKVQQCTAMTSKGTRCNRYCAPGELLCAKHSPMAEPSGVIATQGPMDAMAELRRLMRDRDSRVRLRAVNAYLVRLEKEKKECPRCAARAESASDNEQIVQHASAAQRAELVALIRAIQSIKSAVREYIASGGLPPTRSEGTAPDALRVGEENSHAAVIEHHQPPRPAAEVPQPPVERPDASDPVNASRDDADEVIHVWKDGALRAEPRSARQWKELRS